jgi:hypothetical protein
VKGYGVAYLSAIRGPDRFADNSWHFFALAGRAVVLGESPDQLHPAVQWGIRENIQFWRFPAHPISHVGQLLEALID